VYVDGALYLVPEQGVLDLKALLEQAAATRTLVSIPAQLIRSDEESTPCLLVLNPRATSALAIFERASLPEGHPWPLN
jgi:hypothetical protein